MGTSQSNFVTVKTLSVTLDNHLSLDQHISSVCKSAFFHLCSLCHIRTVLSEDIAKSIAVSLVSSRLDYSNSILFVPLSLTSAKSNESKTLLLK